MALSPAEAARIAEFEAVQHWIADHPDWSLRQFATAWGVAPSTVLRLFQRCEVTLNHHWTYQPCGEPFTHRTGKFLSVADLEALGPTIVAARRYAALRGEECPRSGKSCHDGLDIGSIPQGGADCKLCHGSGKVWNPEVVERVKLAAGHNREGFLYLDDSQARAVLAALTEEES